MKQQEFEQQLTELQRGMVGLALKFVENQAEKVYVYASYEPNMYYFNFFYKIDGQYLRRHELGIWSEKVYEIWDRFESTLLKTGIEDLKKIHQLFRVEQRAMPTEIKLYYNVQTRKFHAQYGYDLKHSHTEDLVPEGICQQWFEEVKAGLDKRDQD